MRRKYLVVFRCGSYLEGKYAELISNDKDMAYSDACAMYGFLDVGG